jgi:hypothetical protein
VAEKAHGVYELLGSNPSTSEAGQCLESAVGESSSPGRAIMPKMTPFNQAEHVATEDPGVCNALVIEWLYNEGRPLAKIKRIIKRAAAVHARGVDDVTFLEYGLQLDAKTMKAFNVRFEVEETPIYAPSKGKGKELTFKLKKQFKVKSDPSTESIIEYVNGLESTKFLIGLDKVTVGHAIGIIRSDTKKHYRGFDPNTGYYEWDDEKRLLPIWLKAKFIFYMNKYGLHNVTVYPIL